MADVFISYSQANLDVAESLANDLKARAFDVWWDFELYAGDDFHDLIAAQIAKAKATVVIWSEAAVASRWVRGEADEAAHLGTLISTHVPGFEPRSVPLNFRTYHCVGVDQFDRVIAAIEQKIAKAGDQTQSENSCSSDDEPRIPDNLTFQASVFYIKQNYEAAALLYMLAAEQGIPEAQFQLAYMYQEGLGVSQNEDEAARLYRIAADQGLDEAEEAIDQMTRQMLE